MSRSPPPSAAAKLADAFPENAAQENVHPNTYAAHPVACAAALANLQIMQKDNLIENAEAMGTRLLEGLRGAIGKSPIVGEVRGRGLMVCAEFVEPNGSGRPLDRNRVAELDRLAWERGAIVYARGHVHPPGPAALHHGGRGRPAGRHRRRQHQGDGKGRQ